MSSRESRISKPMWLGLVLTALLLGGCDPTIHSAAVPASPAIPIISTPPTGVALSISPAQATLATSTTTPFSAAGGESPYSFELVAGVGSIDPAAGTYSAGAIAGTAILRVRDSKDTTALASVTVYSPVQLAPTAQTMMAGSNFTFRAAYGVPPYVYSITSGGGSIGASTGVYTAPAIPGSAVIRVTDSLGNTASATVTLNPALSISPPTLDLAANNTATFAASGGVPPYAFSVRSGAGSIGTATGIYVAPAVSGSATVAVSDSLGDAANATITIHPAILLSPATKTLAVNNTATFAALGGVSPYTYTVAFGGGTLNASTGLYTAPASAGSAVVRATDALGNAATAAVTINPALVISPPAAAMGANGVTSFSASGGLPPYVFSVIGSGTINSSTGAYTAPAGFGNDTVRVTDSLGNVSSASVAINDQLSLSPGIITVAANNTIPFIASGGIAPYTFSITGGGGSIIPDTGVYTAPSAPGTATVQVTDASLGTSTATVTVNPALVISPASFTLAVNNSVTFSATGGVGGHSFSVQSGGGSVNASTGVFVAPGTPGTSVIAATDTRGNVSTAAVTINPALSVAPSTKYQVINSTTTIRPNGGVPPFNYSVLAGAGIVDGNTGSFTAPAASGLTTTIQITDSLLNSTVMNIVSVKPIQLASSSYANCALMDNGTVQCWGRNTNGQLGDGTFRDSFFPVQVQNLTNVASISGAVDGQFFCALIQDGTIRCWGDNGYGEMGVGSSTGSQTIPAQVSGISNATALSLGSGYACALLSDSSIQCWGVNSSGQLGDGTTTQRNVPVPAGGGLNNVVSIAAGANHTCVALSDGTSSCWGSNNYGQLGNNSISILPTSSPVQVTGLANVSKVFAGPSYSCALDTGTLYCWGMNNAGQLALGNTNSYQVPQNTGLTGVTALALGYASVCATFNTPAVECWGSNNYGQVGDGSTTTRTLPTPVSGLTTAVSITANGDSSGAAACALQSTGQIQCWGSNLAGQIGNGGGYAINLPSTVQGLPLPATAVVTGSNHSCALLSDQTIQCWGHNSSGQLGNGTTTDSLSPVPVTGINNAVAIDAGSLHTCALLADHTVECWGYNSSGQLGDGTIIQRSSPVPVSSITTATALSLGFNHSCVRLSDGSMQCWGLNTSGQLGDGSTTNRNTPVPVAALGNNVAGISAGKGYTDKNASCAVLTDGTGRCWGNNIYGQIGNGNQVQQLTPDSVLNLTSIATIFTNGQSTCASLNSRQISCWGYNSSGQLGNGTTTTSYLANSTVVGLINPIAVAMGSAHTCALNAGGTIQCWGSNSRGQLGIGTTGGTMSTPVMVNDSSQFSYLGSSAAERTCAVTSVGTVKCWGLNFYGEIGNGVYGGDVYTPTSVVFR